MEEWRHLDDSWILESGVGPNNNAISGRSGEASAATTEEKKKLKKAKGNSKCSKRFSDGIESGVKKLDHNAKERIRRMKLNASYLALRALLPDSTRSKKKWSAPAIVERVVKYIPELEKEIETLRSNAKEMNPSEGPSTVSMNQLNQEEAVFQVCVARQQHSQSQLTHLLQSLEDEGICIISASALDISHTRICHHLHIQTNDTASEAGNHFEELRDKVIYWLR